MAVMKDIPGPWFKYKLLIEAVGDPLTQGRCYSLTLPPIMDGEYIRENYLGLLRQIHEHLSSRFHGTPIGRVSLKIEGDWQATIPKG